MIHFFVLKKFFWARINIIYKLLFELINYFLNVKKNIILNLKLFFINILSMLVRFFASSICYFCKIYDIKQRKLVNLFLNKNYFYLK